MNNDSITRFEFDSLKRAVEREEQARKDEIAREAERREKQVEQARHDSKRDTESKFELAKSDASLNLHTACTFGTVVAGALFAFMALGLLIHGDRLRALEHKGQPAPSALVKCGNQSSTYTDPSAARGAIDHCFDQD